MSAGTGITHSEMNASDTEPVKFLQIWVLTDAENHTPRYNQIRLAPAKRNELRTIVAPGRPRWRKHGLAPSGCLVLDARPGQGA